MIPYLARLLSTQDAKPVRQVGRLQGPPRLQVHQGVRGQPAAAGERGTEPAQIIIPVGGIQEDDIEGGRLGLEPSARVPTPGTRCRNHVLTDRDKR